MRPSKVRQNITLSIKAIFILYATSCKAQVLFEDSFGGTSLDTSKWEVVLPFESSSVSVNNGYVLSQDRGQIITKQNFGFPYTLSGSFSSSFSDDLIGVTLRTSGSNLGRELWGAASGLGVGFWMAGFINMGESGFDEIPGSRHPFAFELNQTYNFSIHDNGNSVTVKINDIEIMSVVTSYSTGSRIAFDSRETGGNVSYSNIQVVPEPSAVSLLAVALGGLAMMRRRRS